LDDELDKELVRADWADRDLKDEVLGIEMLLLNLWKAVQQLGEMSRLPLEARLRVPVVNAETEQHVDETARFTAGWLGTTDSESLGVLRQSIAGEATTSSRGVGVVTVDERDHERYEGGWQAVTDPAELWRTAPRLDDDTVERMRRLLFGRPRRRAPESKKN
jgi:hypothetical protein